MIGIFLALIDTDEDKARFIDLYEKCRKLMFFVANDILKDATLAEDAVQEAFIRIAKNFHKIADIACPQTKSFVVIITRNIALTMISKETKIIELHEKESHNFANDQDITFEDISYNVLVKEILNLPQKYRDVLYLNNVYGYSYNEISNLLSISVEAVKKRAQRAKLQLKDSIERGSYEKHE